MYYFYEFISFSEKGLFHLSYFFSYLGHPLVYSFMFILLNFNFTKNTKLKRSTYFQIYLFEGGEYVEVALCVGIPITTFVEYLLTPLRYSTKILAREFC